MQLDDDSKKMDSLDFDQESISELIKKNVLGLGQIKLYVVTASKELYAFYFARNALEASSHHQRIFHQQPMNIVEAHRLLHKLMYLVDLDKEMFLIDYRKEVLQFPAYIGHAKAGEYILHRLDQQKGMSQVV